MICFSDLWRSINTQHVCLGLCEASLGRCVLLWCFFGTEVCDWRVEPDQPDVNRQRCTEILNIDAPCLQERRSKHDSTPEI